MESAQQSPRLADLPEVVSARQAFEILRVSAPIGYGLLKRGTLRGIRIGTVWRIPRAEICRFLGITASELAS
jgi:excisionase family DNA binding protein